MLSTLRLLRRLLPSPHHKEDPDVFCIAFATPPFANEALAAEVQQLGWNNYISNFIMPGERRLFGSGSGFLSQDVKYEAVSYVTGM